MTRPRPSNLKIDLPFEDALKRILKAGPMRKRKTRKRATRKAAKRR